METVRIVLDPSFYRAPELETFLQENLGHQVVLTETACMEAYKGDSLVNLSRSLDIVHRYPSQVLILKQTHAIIALQNEDPDAPIDTFIDRKQTQRFPSFWAGVQRAMGGDESLAKQLAENSAAAREHFNQVLAESDQLVEGILETGEYYGEDFLRALRNQTTLTVEMIDRFFKGTMGLAQGLFRLRSLPMPASLSALKKTLLFRYAVAGQLLANAWLGMGGIATVKRERLRNDVLDMSYVAYSTLFDGLLSDDTRMIEIADQAGLLVEQLFRF
jgi:hypothetical protein